MHCILYLLQNHIMCTTIKVAIRTLSFPVSLFLSVTATQIVNVTNVDGTLALNIPPCTEALMRCEHKLF